MLKYFFKKCYSKQCRHQFIWGISKRIFSMTFTLYNTSIFNFKHFCLLSLERNYLKTTASNTYLHWPLLTWPMLPVCKEYSMHLIFLKLSHFENVLYELCFSDIHIDCCFIWQFLHPSQKSRFKPSQILIPCYKYSCDKNTVNLLILAAI